MKALTLKVGNGNLRTLIDKVHTGQKLGFENFDISLSNPRNTAADVIRSVRELGGSVRSVRLIDPTHLMREPERPGFSKLASPIPEIRKASVAAVLATCQGSPGQSLTFILDAASIQAPGVGALEEDIEACLEDGGEGLRELLDRAATLRKQHLDEHLEALCRSMFEIVGGAEGLHFALVTPASALGVCLPDGMEQVLADGNGVRRGYWHSTCRAARLDKAGVVHQEEWLDRFGSKMRGIYLSDRLGAQGEQAPGLGEVNFNCVKPYLGQDTVRVLSISDDESTTKLKYGSEYLSEVGIF